MGYIADVTVGGVNHPVGSSLYGTCDTGAGTAAKVVTMSNFDTLKTGVAIQVKFANANTASTPTLNVGGTGAKNIFYKGSQITTDDTKSLLRGVCMFVYDGTQWCLTSGGNNVFTAGTGLTTSGTALNHSNSVSAQTTQAVYPIKIDAQGHISAYGSAVSPITSHQTIKQDGITGATVNRFGTCSTAAGTAQKEVSITSGTFSLEAGARVTVKFSNANTASTPTLKVGSTAAKNIFHGGAQITTGDNKSLLKGVCDFVYDGTQYHLIESHSDDGGTMIVTFTRTGSISSSTYTADKTYVEIQAALNAGKTVLGVAILSTATSADDCYVFHVDKYDKGENSSNSNFVFSYHTISNNGMGQYYYEHKIFRISDNNSVLYDSHLYPFDYGDLSFYMLASYITGDTPEEGGYYITDSSINDFTAFLDRDYYDLPRDMATGVLVVASAGQYDGNSYYTDPEYGSTWYNQYLRAFSEIFYFSDCSVSSEYYANNGDPYFVDFATLTFKNMDNTKIATVQTQLHNWDIGYGTPVTITETGIGGVMWVQFSYSGGTWSANKTYAQIKAALDEGKTVLGKWDGNIYYVNKDYISSSTNKYITFSYEWYQLSLITVYHLSVMMNDTVFYNAYSYPNYEDNVPTASIYMWYDPDHEFSNNNYYISGCSTSSGSNITDIAELTDKYTVFIKLLTAYHDDGELDNAEILYLTNIENTYAIQGDWNYCTLQFENSTRTVTIQGTPWTYNYLNDVTITSTPKSELPASPSTNGTYILKCVVSNGTPTYSWEAVQSGSGVQF